MSERPRPLTQLEHYDPTTKRDNQENTREADIVATSDSATVFSSRVAKGLPVEARGGYSVREESSLDSTKNGPAGSGVPLAARRIGTTFQKSHHTLMSLDQAGPSIIGYDDTIPPNLVAIKRVKRPNNITITRLPCYSSNQLVSILDAYLDNNEIVFVYEAMDISVRQMAGVSSLQAFQLAAICKQVSLSCEWEFLCDTKS